MSFKSSFILLADYNKQMNTAIYLAASQLDKEALEQDRGAFFSSIIGTLNHILVGDTLWLRRFAEHPQNFASLAPLKSQIMPTALDQILHSDIAPLMLARQEMDQIICQFSAEISEQSLASSLSYYNSKGEASTRNFAYLIQHLFNHQTHHRGQASTLLFQAGIDIGGTDLLICIPQAISYKA